MCVQQLNDISSRGPSFIKSCLKHQKKLSTDIMYPAGKCHQPKYHGTLTVCDWYFAYLLLSRNMLSKMFVLKADLWDGTYSFHSRRRGRTPKRKTPYSNPSHMFNDACLTLTLFGSSLTRSSLYFLHSLSLPFFLVLSRSSSCNTTTHHLASHNAPTVRYLKMCTLCRRHNL